MSTSGSYALLVLATVLAALAVHLFTAEQLQAWAATAPIVLLALQPPTRPAP